MKYHILFFCLVTILAAGLSHSRVALATTGCPKVRYDVGEFEDMSPEECAKWKKDNSPEALEEDRLRKEKVKREAATEAASRERTERFYKRATDLLDQRLVTGKCESPQDAEDFRTEASAVFKDETETIAVIKNNRKERIRQILAKFNSSCQDVAGSGKSRGSKPTTAPGAAR